MIKVKKGKINVFGTKHEIKTDIAFLIYELVVDYKQLSFKDIDDIILYVKNCKW